MDAGLKRELEAKVSAGERLSREDGEALFASDDLAWLGRLAHQRRTELNGDRVLFGLEPADAGPAVATMTYGDDEEPSARVDHLIRLRASQDESGGVLVFLLRRHDRDSPDGKVKSAAPAESLKTFAVSRLVLDNVPHIGCSWATLGLSVAQLTLNFGADDLDGSVTDEGTTRDDLLTLIGDAGFQPVERDARYEVVQAYDRAPSLAERRSEPQKVWA